MNPVERIRALMEKAVSPCEGDAVLMSGGLDTSIVVALASKRGGLRGYTVALTGFPAPDVVYASVVAKRFGVRHAVLFCTVEEALKAVKEVIRVLGTFDPMEVRNSVPVYLGLKLAREGAQTRF